MMNTRIDRTKNTEMCQSRTVHALFTLETSVVNSTANDVDSVEEKKRNMSMMT